MKLELSAFELGMAYFLAAEALAVFKLLFFRTKDIGDLERLIAVQGKNLNSAYVRKQISCCET